MLLKQRPYFLHDVLNFLRQIVLVVCEITPDWLRPAGVIFKTCDHVEVHLRDEIADRAEVYLVGLKLLLQPEG